jgi:ankyrin repeat protein
LASKNGYTKCISLLLDNGADLFDIDYTNKSSFDYAIVYDNLELLNLLLKKAGQIDAKFVKNMDLKSNIITYTYEVIKYLYDNHNQFHISNSTLHILLLEAFKKKDSDFLRFIISCELSYQEEANTLEKLLIKAIKSESNDIINNLLEYDIDINYKNNLQQNMLHIASIAQSPLNIIKIIIKKGCEINCFDRDGYTPLHYLIKNYFQTQDLFLDHKDLVGFFNEDDILIIKYIISKGAMITVKNTDNCITASKELINNVSLKHIEPIINLTTNDSYYKIDSILNKQNNFEDFTSVSIPHL